MRYFNKSIKRQLGRMGIAMAMSFLCVNYAHAWTVFADYLYWRATNTQEWAYLNSLSVPNQTLTYKTLSYPYHSGFRVGASNNKEWDTTFYYTHYQTTTRDTAVGNIIPSFLGSVTAKPFEGYFYQAGQVKATIKYNIFDLNIGRSMQLADALTVRPYVGAIGGSIYQAVYANYQGLRSTNETVHNNFSGVGPKVGVDADITLTQSDNSELKLIAKVAGSYLAGHWSITDQTQVTPPTSITISIPSRNMGAPVLQAEMGLKFNYHQLAFKVGYEINDWFNQNQLFDNDTGTHSNDLILQGLTVGLTYLF